jgi:hypothetical protein
MEQVASADVKDTNVLGNDTISREVAIDACLELLEARRKWDTAEGRAEMRGIDAVVCAIHDLQPAQPPVLTCNGCRHVGTYDTDFPCSGCIRREKDYYEQER